MCVQLIVNLLLLQFVFVREAVGSFVLFIPCFVSDMNILTVPTAAHFIAVHFTANYLLPV